MGKWKRMGSIRRNPPAGRLWMEAGLLRGQLEVDVAKVADAVREALAARGAVGVLGARAHPVVQHAVLHRGPVVVLWGMKSGILRSI